MPASINAIWDRFEARVTGGFDDRQMRLWNVLVFLVRFLLLAIPLHLILWLNFDAHGLQVFTARSVSFLLYLAGVGHEVVDVFLILKLGSMRWTIEIIRDCVGWKSFMAVLGLVFAVRGVGTDRRVIGGVAAIPLVYAGNALRIFSSIYLSVLFGYEWFDFIHGVLWQGGMIALVIAIWWVWLEKVADVDGVAKKSRRRR